MYSNILITGGAGFVGSNLAIFFKRQYPDAEVISFDNLKRRGSELNIPRLKDAGVQFIHGDIRNEEDFLEIPPFDLMIECSAEPSVMAGVESSPKYLLNTNLVGTIHCLEEVRKNKADLVFLSTSRVYPIETINQIDYSETETRFIPNNPSCIGFTNKGIAESLPLSGSRSLYGTTKLCSELLIEEYVASYGIKAVINRCGLITGPWQMGKVDQGVIVLWVANHLFNRQLQYIGYGGEGKQVRDALHIEDLCRLIELQVTDVNKYSGRVFNVGGGLENSVSLKELTRICMEVTGRSIPIASISETRPNDLIWYVTDNTSISTLSGWSPEKTINDIVSDIAAWIIDNKGSLSRIL